MREDRRVNTREDDGGHKWWMWHGMKCCEKCGIIYNGHNKTCRGVVKVELRK